LLAVLELVDPMLLGAPKKALTVKTVELVEEEYERATRSGLLDDNEVDKETLTVLFESMEYDVTTIGLIRIWGKATDNGLEKLELDEGLLLVITVKKADP
jgi:hypothetical protein